jgi:putative solute:sodium symporter small subunit
VLTEKDNCARAQANDPEGLNAVCLSGEVVSRALPTLRRANPVWPPHNRWDAIKMASTPPSDRARLEEHWRRTRSLMWLTLAIWFFFSFVIHFFVTPLNQIVFLGFPLGFYMAAQGSLIAFVVLLFWFAYRQNKIDEECGVEEE